MFTDAVKAIYGSVYKPDALSHREKHRIRKGEQEIDLLHEFESMALLVQRHYGDAVALPGAPSAIPEAMLGDAWMGVYMKGEKVGYSRTSITRREGGYSLGEEMLMRLRVLGEDKEVRTSLEARFDEALYTAQRIDG